MRIKAAIFDMDGLMLDTEPLYRAAWQQAAIEIGYTFSEAVYSRLIGRNLPDSEQIVMEEFGPEFPMDAFRDRRRKLETAFQSVPVPKKRGLDELLVLLDSWHIPKAVATSTRRAIAVPQLAASELLNRFEVLATGDEVPHGKPAPDLFLLAAHRLAVDPAACLVLEDAEPGIIAAHRAGMKVFFVPDLQIPPEPVLRLADGIFDSLAEVARQLKSSADSRHDDHVMQTIATYNLIAPDYKLTATPEMRSWEENSMRTFCGYLSGNRVLVPGCGDGRDSRYLASQGLAITSFDLSEEMLKIARVQDPEGTYTLMDLRNIEACAGPYDGIFASGCLYHLAKSEFLKCLQSCYDLLSPAGIFYFNLKEGRGERFEEKPGPSYPGGLEARERLEGKRFYSYYQREDLAQALAAFEILREQKLIPGDGGFEFWLRKSAGAS